VYKSGFSNISDTCATGRVEGMRVRRLPLPHCHSPFGRPRLPAKYAFIFKANCIKNTSHFASVLLFQLQLHNCTLFLQ